MRTLALLSLAPIMMAQTISGIWQATLTANGAEIPFRIELSGDSTRVSGTLFNGDERFTSTSGNFSNGALQLKWDYFASHLDATLKDGKLEGEYVRPTVKPY